jgi:HEPN domain-containing protein
MRRSPLEEGERYPNSLPDGIPANVYTQEAAQHAVAMAEEAVSYVKWLLNQISKSN